MKIAVFTDSFFPSVGGTERAVYNLCKNLLTLGHQIILFAPDYHREQNFDEFEVGRVKSIKLSHNDMAVFRAGYKKVLKRVKEFAPDVIQFCTASGMATMGLKVGRKLGIPVVATIHTKFREAFYDGCKSRLITEIMIKSLARKLNKADRVTTVSHDMARELFKYGYKGKVEVIRNGFDGLNPDLKSEKDIDFDNINFLFCGHLIKVKNIQFSFKFILVGEGNYKKKLQKLTKKANLTDNVVFHGLEKDREKLDMLYKKSLVVLFPSIFDNDSLVICEAARQGTPTLTIEGTGSSERITNNENGFVSAFDKRSFAERIYEIVNDKELYNHVCENIATISGKTWLEIAKEYEMMFEELIEAKAKK